MDGPIYIYIIISQYEQIVLYNYILRYTYIHTAIYIYMYYNMPVPMCVFIVNEANSVTEGAATYYSDETLQYIF